MLCVTDFLSSTHLPEFGIWRRWCSPATTICSTDRRERRMDIQSFIYAIDTMLDTKRKRHIGIFSAFSEVWCSAIQSRIKGKLVFGRHHHVCYYCAGYIFCYCLWNMQRNRTRRATVFEKSNEHLNGQITEILRQENLRKERVAYDRGLYDGRSTDTLYRKMLSKYSAGEQATVMMYGDDETTRRK